jgi:alpha-aminoadipate carrier protein LysW
LFFYSSAVLEHRTILRHIYHKGEYIMTSLPTTLCPECSAEIGLESGTVIGEILVCPDCGVDLEVISLQPLAVELAPMEQEDWGE